MAATFNPKEFDWDRYRYTSVYAAAAAAKEWGLSALGSEEFPRGNQKDSLRIMLRFLGYDDNFIFQRPKPVNPARFLQFGVFNLEMFLALSSPTVYDMFTARERDEIITMAMFVGIYYIPYFP